jgi:hypothetical protein
MLRQQSFIRGMTTLAALTALLVVETGSAIGGSGSRFGPGFFPGFYGFGPGFFPGFQHIPKQSARWPQRGAGSSLICA